MAHWLKARWWIAQQWYWGWRYPVSQAELDADFEAIRHELWKADHGWSEVRTLEP